MQENKREHKNMKLFELEKVFIRENKNSVSEHYELSGLEQIS